MRKLLKKILKNDNGQVIVLFPFLFIIMCGFLGLAADTSWIVYNKHKLQNSTDLAALSGAQSLPNTSNASSEISSYLLKNYEKSVVSNIRFSESNSRIDIDCEDNLNLFFAPLFGVDTATIKASASVQSGPVNKPGNVIPVGIDKDTHFIFNQETTLYSSFKSKGNFGLLNFDGGGSDKIEDYIENGYKGNIPFVGKFIDTKPGKTTGPVIKAFNERLNINPIVTCPIINWSESLAGASVKVQIVGYTTFKVTSVEHAGSEIKITGKFIEYFDPEGIPGGGADYGTKSISLIK